MEQIFIQLAKNTVELDFFIKSSTCTVHTVNCSDTNQSENSALRN